MCSLGLNMHDTYIYAFSRRFYPKWLTLHSSYSFTFYQLLLPLGIKPMILALLVPCSTIWATGKPLSYFWHHRRFGCARDMFEQIVMIDTLRNRPSAVFAGGIVQWLLWMTDREPRLWSHDSTPAVWGTAWSLIFPVTWCRCCFILLRVPAEKSLERVHLFSLAWPTSST